jgi:hypothetical protein
MWIVSALRNYVSTYVAPDQKTLTVATKFAVPLAPPTPRPHLNVLAPKSTQTKILTAAVMVSELTHVVAHASVLLRLKSIAHLSHAQHIGYFGWDMLSNMAAYKLTGKNALWAGVHAAVHLGAVAHLTGLYETDIFKQIFSMGANQFADKSLGMQAFYVIGTAQDIITHGLHFLTLWEQSQLQCLS